LETWNAATRSRYSIAFFLPHTFIAFEHHAAAFEHLRKLCIEFGAQELDNSQSGDMSVCRIAGRFGAI